MKVKLKALSLGGLILLGNSLVGQDLPEAPNAGLVTPSQSPKVAGSQAEEMVTPDTIQFPNNPVSDFLMVYERLKGVTLIKDASLLAGGANLSLTLNQPVSKAEAIRLIESTLLLNGYAFIAVDKNSVKVINTAGGKNPRVRECFFLRMRVSCRRGRWWRPTLCL